MSVVEARRAEHAKYERAYAQERYRMGEQRMDDAVRNLALIRHRGSYLDVGCGRGEMLTHAGRLGFRPVCGVEVVPALIDGRRVIWGEAYTLPFRDQSWDVVTLFDVLEHIRPGDDELVIRELLRVARHHVLWTANSLSSTLPDGTELHVNRRPIEEWARLFEAWCGPAVPYRAPAKILYDVSPMWRVDL